MDDNTDIIVDKISKVFHTPTGSVQALRDVSFSVRRGSLFCVVGPSGCGKTTLLKILVGLADSSAGTVSIDSGRANAGTAYVHQSALLLPWRTLLQNAALGVELKGSMNQTKLWRLSEEIREYGLSGFEQSLPSELSGGMSQRVAVIRALESRPKILFCDEPFSAVDFVTRLELNTKFKYMCRVQEITTVFVTHNIEEAIFLGDEIVVMSGRPGRIVNSYRPNLSIGSEDAVKCRASPEFSDLFLKIWQDLGNSNVSTI